jgi:hypothetical protein
MEFADAGEGWLLAETGYGTLLLHTIDGGTHWGAVAMNETWSLRSMHFSGHARGWLVGGADTILATTDGGGMAPMSTSNIRQSVKWTNKAFTVRFTTLDDGYGLAPTQSRLGDGPWEEAPSRLFAAPSNHSNDGYHLVRYRGVDLAGNREAARIALVVVDTRRPSFDARSRVTVRQMRNASLRLKSADKLSATVRVRGVVSTLQGRQVDTIRASLRADGVWHSVRYFCTLKAGTYRVVISVRDRAGNSSARSQTMTLVVRGR